MSRLAGWCAAVLSLAGAVVGGPARACDCEPLPIEEAYATAAVVFVGKAVRVDHPDGSAHPEVDVFQVSSSWKRPLGTVAVLHGSIASGDCTGYSFELGSDYLVFAAAGRAADSRAWAGHLPADREVLWSATCSGTRRLSAAGKALAWLESQLTAAVAAATAAGAVPPGGASFERLLEAVRKGDIELARASVEAGAEVNSISASGDRALVLAIDRGDPNMTRWLLERGAAPDLPDASGWRPLQLAAARGNRALVDLLLGAGADVRILGRGLRTPAEQADAAGFRGLGVYLRTRPPAATTSPTPTPTPAGGPSPAPSESPRPGRPL